MPASAHTAHLQLHLLMRACIHCCSFCLLDLQGAVEARNRDYANIVRSLNFVSKGWYDTQVLADDDDIRRKVNSLKGLHMFCA